MDLPDLETFLAVADCRSFSRAGERLHLTQPAVTKRIQALEANLDTILFDRVGKQVELTHGGRLLLPRARSLLAGMADTRRLLRNLSRQVTGSLHLATSHHVGLHRLSPVLKAFSDRYQDVRLDIRFEDSEAAHELVRRGDSELAVVTLDPAGASGLDSTVLWDDPLVFLVADDHPLAAREHVPLAELADHPAILPGLATYTGRIVAELFRARGIELTSHLSTNYLETISMLAGIGLGWSVLPSSMLTGNLTSLATDAPPLRRSLGCVTNPARTRSNAAGAFLEVLAEFAD
ncbi:MAG TPA: LysR family transcriptional regulator [Pseudomonadales bacterium]